MFLNSVEFYVIAALFAAAIVAYFSRPASKGPARQFLLAGNLYTPVPGAPTTPSIELTCNDDATVTLTRHGLTDVSPDGAVSLSVTVIGLDITIKERTVCGRETPSTTMSADFIIDFLGREWYHITYINESTQLIAAFNLHVRPGIHSLKPLS